MKDKNKMKKIIPPPRERYILHASGARLALWYRNGALYIGGHVSLKQLVEDIFVVGFNLVPPEWTRTTQRCKYRSSVPLSRDDFDTGMDRLRDAGTIVIEGPVRSLGRIAI